MNNLLGTSALIAVGTLAALMPVRPARAQQGFNSGGLNTCSIIYNQNLQAISTCYGYINGVPEFFTQQPSGSALPLQFDNFIGLVGHTPAPISISTSGSVTIAGGINFGGTINVGLPGILWNLPNPHFTGQTTSQTPLWNVQALTVNGTLGCGTLCARAPEYDIQSENIKDTVVMNNGAFTANHHNFYFFGPSSGGKIDAIFDMRQAGPLTPDVTLNTHGQNVQKQTSIGVFNPWLSINDTAGGSIDGSGLIHPFGLAYGGNPKVTLAGAGSGRPGAAMWAAVVANGEVDIGIEPSQNTIVATGSVTVGDTLNVAIGSVTNPGFGTVTVSTVAIAGDTMGLLIQKLCGQIKFNTTLNFNGVGAGCYGATDTLNSQLNISWPLTSIIGTGGSTDVTITPSVTGAGTEILTLGTAVPGASARLKTAQSIVQLKLDGSNGYGNDTVWYFAKQSNGAGWSSGGWRSIWEIGGGGSAPFDDVNSQDIEPSSWPMRFDADLIMFLAQTNVSGAPDAPAQNMQLHSVVDARNIDFLTAGGGPVLSPGYQLWGNGDQTVGSGTLSRLTGNAAAAGVALSANGWEGTSVALVSGGGSNCGTADPTCLEHRYYKGDICEDAVNGVYQVDSTGTIGNVLTFHPVVTGTHTGYPSAAAGSVPATNQPVIGCSGTGWVNGITWTAGNTVRIGGSGQTVDIQGTVFGGAITVLPTGSSLTSTLNQNLSTNFSLWNFTGAICDNSTDTTSSITGMQTAGGGFIPQTGSYCVTSLAGGSGSLTGPFRGPGQIKASGSPLGPVFSAVTAEPSLGTWTSLSTSFSGDNSKVLSAIDHRVLGAGSAGAPATGYLIVPEVSGRILSAYSTAGHNESTSGNDGRTGIFGEYGKLWQFGQGDLTQYGCFGINASTKPGATSWLASPAIECLGGELFGSADGQYIEFLGDLDISDNGTDIAAQGIVYNSIRTNGAEGIGQSWNGISIQNTGSVPVESSIRTTGPQMELWDATKSTLSTYILASDSILTVGTGYTTGDIVTVSGGTVVTGAASVASSATKFTVTASGGNITNLVPLNVGQYTVPPTLSTPGTLNLTGGTGTGGQITATYYKNNDVLFPIGGCLRLGASNAGSSFSNTATPGFGDAVCSFTGGLAVGDGNNSITSAAGAGTVLIGTNNLGTSARGSIIVGTGGYDDAQVNRFTVSAAAQNGFGSLQRAYTTLYGACTASCRMTSQSNVTATTTNSYLVVASSDHNGTVRCKALDTTNQDTANWNDKVVVLTRTAAGSAAYQGTLTAAAATTPDFSTGAGSTATVAFDIDNASAVATFKATFVPPNAHIWDASCSMTMDKQM